MLKKINYAGAKNEQKEFMFSQIDLKQLKRLTGNIPEPYSFSFYNPKNNAYSKRGKYSIRNAMKVYHGRMVNCVLFDEEEGYVNIVFNSKEI